MTLIKLYYLCKSLFTTLKGLYITMKFTTNLDRIIVALNIWETQFPDNIAQLIELKKDVSTKLARFNSEAQKLSIGIIGQVKAGKSSFLNTLLFQGRSLLPESITPETANLTRISYAETPELIVYFYTREEWRDLVAIAQTDANNAEAKVAKSLVGLAEKHQLDINTLLSQEKLSLSAHNMDELMQTLKEYVGADGKYTALVKSTELYLDLKELEGFDIVDTPGMNDPVRSRTQKTRDYMAECDVVFFISHCSRFLDAADTDLLSRQLPQKGVKHIVLVGSQFDSALDDDASNYDSLAEAEEKIKAGFARRAANEMEKLAKQREDHENPELALLLRNLKTPILCSSYAYRFANWPKESWSASMNKVYENFEYHAEDFWNQQLLTQDDWSRIANFHSLDVAFDFARQEKQTLLEKQKSSLLPEAKERAKTTLKELKALALQRIQLLETHDLASIEKQQQAATSQINRISTALMAEFDLLLQNINQQKQIIIGELLQDKNNQGGLQERTGTREETHSYRVSTSKWYNPFSWGNSRTEYYTTTETYKYVATADAIEKAVNYQRASSKELEQSFNQLIRTDILKSKLKKVLLDVIDTSSENFDPKLFRASFENSITKLEIPTLQLTVPDMSSQISQQFSTKEVKGQSEQDRLKQVLQDVLTSIYEALANAFEISACTLNDQLESLKDTLNDQFSLDVKNELQQLKSILNDKEKELTSYQNLLGLIESEIN